MALRSALPPLCVTKDTVKENCFSKHDNRHAFQSSGVYFGQGLGKKPVTQGRNQHRSADHISWTASGSGHNTKTASTYITDYHERLQMDTLSSSNRLPKLFQLEDSSLPHKFQIFSKTTFHRYPRSHTAQVRRLPPPPPLSRLAEWFPHDDCRDGGLTPTSLSVLAESQRPFLPHNPWSYSYRS